MITVKKAIEIIENSAVQLKAEQIPLLNCLNFISAEEVFAPVNVPAFDNSAMDGYAFCFEDFENNAEIKITDEIQAGTSLLNPLKNGEASRIFTGAPIPENADTVVPQEDVLVENGVLKFQKDVVKGANIRLKGTQTQKGNLVLKKSTRLTPEYIGFLATLGISELSVYSKPKVGIIVTGKELVTLGNPLQQHQIYESNSVFLRAALQKLDINPVFSIWVDDDAEALKKMVIEKYKTVDILLFTGGISVGNYDFVKPVLEDLGVEELFYKVKQKPGKPLFFGNLEKTSVFALPGNPSAVVTCFHAYLKPFLKAKMGFIDFNQKHFGILMTEYSKKAGLTHFVKAYVENNKVEILPNQLSYQMDAYSKANALVILREEQEFFQMGEKIEIIPFS